MIALQNAITKESFASLLRIMIFVTNILTDNPPKVKLLIGTFLLIILL